MKKILLLTLLNLSLVSFAQSPTSLKPIKVSFQIDDVQIEEGYWMLAVYNERNEFLSMKPFNAKRQKVGKKKNIIKLKLPKGKYAAALFQDLNNNKNLERGQYGIPAEPYSFSGQNIFPLRGKPTFKQCSIVVENESDFFILDLQSQSKK